MSIKKLWNGLASKGVIAVLLIIFIAAAILYSSKNFFMLGSILNLLRKTAIDGGMLAIGMTFVLLVGCIDLSVGSVVALSAVIAAILTPFGPIVAIIGAIAVTLVVGYANGLLVVKLKLLPFIATLSTMLGIKGIVLIISNQRSVSIDDGGVFTLIANGKLFDVPIPIFILLLAVFVCMFIARNTRFGMGLYAVGGNEEAAKTMGIRTERIKCGAYIMCALFAGINGVLLASRLNAGQPVAAEGWEMIAIASAALGGTKLTGGVGKFSGTFFGMLIIGTINTIFNYQGNMNIWRQNVIMGAILFIAIIIQSDVIHLRQPRIKAVKSSV